MSGLWMWLKARFRLDLRAVCEMSRYRGMADFHTFHDSDIQSGSLRQRCVRCGKEFIA